MDKLVDVTFTREFINEFAMQVRKSIGKMGYKGCTNCKCGKLSCCPYDHDQTVHIICPGWVKSGEINDELIKEAIRDAYMSGYVDANCERPIDPNNTIDRIISGMPFM